jgi:hypothetical protein
VGGILAVCAQPFDFAGANDFISSAAQSRKWGRESGRGVLVLRRGRATYVSIQVADFNRDGRTDILCGTSVLLSNGDGSFSSTGTAGTMPMESVSPVGDFNGDPIPDVLLWRPSGNLAVALGQRDGTFGAELALRYALPPGIYATFLRPTIRATGKWRRNIPVSRLLRFHRLSLRAALDSLSYDYSYQFTAVGDLNGDRLPNLVVYVIDKIRDRPDPRRGRSRLSAKR